MSRGQKKFLYGLFYLAVAGFVILVFVQFSSAPQPPCSDSSCGIKQPLPLGVGAVQIFKSESAKKIVLLGSVKNPNSDYGVNYFSYEFSILGRSGGLIAKVTGADKIYPGEAKYILKSYDAAGLDLKTVAGQADLKVRNAIFRPAVEFLKPALVLISGPVTNIGSDRITVSGTVKNQGTSPVGGVRVTALLENQYGDPVAASETTLGGIPGFGETSFSVYFPADQSLAQALNAGKTEVFLSPE